MAERYNLSGEFNKQSILDLIHHISDTIIRPNFKNPDNIVREKTSPQDLQTEADVKSERAFYAELPKILPGSVVVGEEEVDSNPETLDRLKLKDTPVWVVDPIDGTRNFAQGRPTFGLMVALVVNQKATHGWIYDIPGDRMAMAEAGQGASLNGVSLTLSAKESTWENLSGFALRTRAVKDIEARHGKMDLVSLGCAAHEYLALATGERDFSIYKQIKPWDHLAGTLILTEAGGLSQHWDGSVYSPVRKDGGLVNAREQTAIDKIRSTLNPEKAGLT